MARKLIRRGRIVTMDRALGDFVSADLLIEDDRIAAVGPNLAVDNAETIDADGMIVLPGLVNAHLHTWQTGLRGLAADWTGPDYHRDMHGNLATRFTPDDNYIGNLMGALDQINGGVTTIFDWCHNITTLEHAERAVDGLEESGIRAVFGHGTAKPMFAADQTPFSHQPHPRERVEALRKGRFAADDRRVTLSLAILGPQFSTADVTKHDFRLARELAILSTSHASRRRSDWLNPEGYRLAVEIGALGPDHNLVHANYLEDDELKLVLDHGASITVTSMIELHVHPADPVSERMRNRGAMPSLGIDSIPTANSDMFNEMRTVLLFQQAREQRHNYREGKPPLPRLSTTSRDVLEWATIGGARALRMEDRIGSLTPRKKADVILINGNDLNLFPVHDPVPSIVQQANGANVDTVLIDGQIVKRHGKLLHSAADLSRKRDALMESSIRIIHDAGFSDRYPMPPAHRCGPIPGT
jgi:cytosine/adenosine deaminase-related metal-dependent hydrolase